jgi:hypothetical protein
MAFLIVRRVNGAGGESDQERGDCEAADGFEITHE